MPIPLIVLALVCILITIRQVGRIKLQIWQVMFGGAVIVPALQTISPAAAARSINLNVIHFLFGVFVLGKALEQSGCLDELSYR